MRRGVKLVRPVPALAPDGSILVPEPIDPALPAFGTLLDGRVRYDQYLHGYRTGIEPVLLAAAIAAKPGQRVIEAGCGAGAALLCLAARVPGIEGLGVERDPALAALARDNAKANRFDTLTFEAAAIEAFAAPGRFDHAMANPPWHDEDGTVSPNPGRASAKRANPALLKDWTEALVACLRPRGILTLILPAAQIDRAMATLAEAGCGSFNLIPFWPREGIAARLAILQARTGGRAPFSLQAGIALHTGIDAYTDAANRILRHGGALG